MVDSRERNNVSAVSSLGGQIISNMALRYFDNLSCGLLSVLGVVTNCLNIAVFIKQGVGDSVHVSLISLTCWDLLKCLCGVIMRLNVPFWLNDPAFVITWDTIMASKVAYFQIMSHYVAYPIAAYISVERALCVSIPFHVKHIITPRLTACLMLAISCVVSGMFVLIIFIYDVSFIFQKEYNKSVAIFYYSKFYNLHGPVFMEYYNLMGILNPVLSLIIIVASSFIITYNLRNSSKIRTEYLRSEDKKSAKYLSVRDRKVIKMLLVVIVSFLVTLVPRVAHQLTKLVEPEYYIKRRYGGYFGICVTIVYIFDFLNASTNFFIFLIMSSAFRAVFCEILCLLHVKNTNIPRCRVVEPRESFQPPVIHE